MKIYQKQLDLLERMLVEHPETFRESFINMGQEAIVNEFRQKELSESFTITFWKLLLTNDDMSSLLLRFIWAHTFLIVIPCSRDSLMVGQQKTISHPIFGHHKNVMRTLTW